MTIEAEKPEGSEQLNIVDATILIDDKEVVIPTVGGRAYRDRVAAQLGKRFVCAQEIVTITTREVTDPKTNQPTTVTNRLISYLDTGQGKTIKDTEGNSIYLGCGTEMLCIKPSTTKDGPECCGIPMVVKQPQTLPTAD